MALTFMSHEPTVGETVMWVLGNDALKHVDTSQIHLQVILSMS